MSKNAPFRYDFVGSFLRPAQLKQARADFESGKISEKQLEEVENEAIRDLVEKHFSRKHGPNAYYGQKK